MTAEEVNALVQAEIKKINDPLVYNAITSFLISPSFRQRLWEWGKTQEEYSCWTVLQHEDSNTDIVYSEQGFGPKNPWGLVFSSPRKGFGADSAWFQSLELAFCDSFAANDLKIWNVVLITNKTEKIIQAQNLDLEKAFALRDELLAASKDQNYRVERRQYYPANT